MAASTPPPRHAPRPLRAAVLALTLVLTLGACTSDGDGPGPPDGTGPGQTLSSTEVALETRVTRLAGRMPPKRREEVADGIGRVVARHLDRAYLRDYPMQGPGKAFADFTAGARQQARRDQRLLTGSGLRKAQDVAVTDAAAYVALLAPQRHVVGATARLEVDLRVETKLGPQKVRVRGRLMLTPTAEGWRIFGYDLTRSGLATGKRTRSTSDNRSGNEKAGAKAGGKTPGGTS